MYTPTASYKMSRQSKRIISQIQDPHERGEAKRMIILSELHNEHKSRSRNGREIKAAVEDTE